MEDGEDHQRPGQVEMDFTRDVRLVGSPLRVAGTENQPNTLIGSPSAVEIR